VVGCWRIERAVAKLRVMPAAELPMRRTLTLLLLVFALTAPADAQRRGGGAVPATDAQRRGGSAAPATDAQRRGGSAVPATDAGAEVRAMFASYSRALNAADWKRVLTFYADDPRFEWIEDGEVRYPSKEALAPSFEAMHETGSTIVFKTEPPHVAVLAPGVAALRTSFETTIVDKEGKPFTFGGLLTIDLIKMKDGWKFLRGHTSSISGGR
jgi:uncharacterized protein (TIGR02246 family)